MRFSIVPTGLLFAAGALAHGDGHGEIEVPPNADWALRHLIEEHHISNFEAGVFFSLHDYDSTGQWGPEDIRRTYGLRDESTASISEDKKASAVRVIMDMFDVDKDGFIEYDEFVSGIAAGKQLPDFGFGPGHHGDDEYEYEIHHFEKFHGEDATEEELTHPEDIEHFRKHEQMEAEQAAWELRARSGIVEANIPTKFRRPGT